jgi:hypothetical protein
MEVREPRGAGLGAQPSWTSALVPSSAIGNHDGWGGCDRLDRVVGQVIPIADALLHPPIGLLKRESIGTFTGAQDFTRATGALAPFNHVNAYGLSWDAFTIPAGFGRTPGSPTVYEQRLCQVSVVYTDFAGHDLIGEYHDVFVEGIYFEWVEPGPTKVHVEIAPGVSLTFFWLIVSLP